MTVTVAVLVVVVVVVVVIVVVVVVVVVSITSPPENCQLVLFKTKFFELLLLFSEGKM